MSVGFLTAGYLGETPLAVAAAWAIGYPIAFVVMLGMIMGQTGLRLPTLAQHTWRIIACTVGAGVGGALLHHGLANVEPGVRLVLTGVCTVVVGFGAMMLWADFSPRAVARAFKR